MKQKISLLVLMLILNLTTFANKFQAIDINPGGSISVEDVTRIVKVQNLKLKTALKDIQAKNQRINQAAVLPNPEFEIESENIYGSGEYAKLDNAETTIKIGTPIELGGKRHHRIKAAKLNKMISMHMYALVLSDVMKQTRQLGIDVLKQQDLLELAKKRVKTNQSLLNEIKVRVEKGRLSIVEQKRANILVSQSELAIKKRNLALTKSRNQLSLMWGFPEAQFDNIQGNIENIDPLPSLDVLDSQLDQSVALKIKKEVLELSRTNNSIERSLGVPDLTLSGGIKHDRSTKDKSYVISGSFPLPIFDRNTGAIKASEYLLIEKELELEKLSLEYQNKLNSLHHELTVLKIEISELKQKIIPQAKDVFNTLKDGYLQGKFSYLAVLEAQNSLFEFKESYIETLVQYHKLFFEIKQLTGEIIEGEENE